MEHKTTSVFYYKSIVNVDIKLQHHKTTEDGHDPILISYLLHLYEYVEEYSDKNMLSTDPKILLNCSNKVYCIRFIIIDCECKSFSRLLLFMHGYMSLFWF